METTITFLKFAIAGIVAFWIYETILMIFAAMHIRALKKKIHRLKSEIKEHQKFIEEYHSKLGTP